jgi:predicted nucleic acid-binding protein
MFAKSAKEDLMIIDTDVLIWYMRGDKNAYKTIEKLNGFYTSVVTYIELVQGLRNKTELIELRKAFRLWDTKILYINEEISAKAMFYIERHYLSHSLQLADALIASTAITNGLPLLTGNDKHYKVIKELSIAKFRPSSE